MVAIIRIMGTPHECRNLFSSLHGGAFFNAHLWG